MIFVTIGTFAFPRLIRKMDEIAAEIDEQVIMQLGYTKYSCKNAKCFQFADYEDIIGYFKQARVIVCHDGVGTIITALQFNKPIIAVQRLKRYGELYYDSRGVFINTLAGEGIVVPLYDLDKLSLAISNVDVVNPSMSDDRANLTQALSEYFESVQKAKSNKNC